MTELSKQIGTIYADCTKNRTARTVIENGFWGGTEMFAQVVAALQNLENSLIAYGFRESDSNYRDVKRARIQLFDSLKQIENAVSQTSSFVPKIKENANEKF
ncbi:MAG: hypothetical protein LUM44_12270 [Pyrinomonadaceae bacterium]|nr:hypothetical protein [Pyrinomonadaceae bacterium]